MNYIVSGNPSENKKTYSCIRLVNLQESEKTDKIMHRNSIGEQFLPHNRMDKPIMATWQS